MAVSDPLQVEVPARSKGVPLAEVEAGQTWRFEATGSWYDTPFKVGPQGWRVAALDFLDIRPQVKDAPWLALVGCVEGGAETVKIGCGCEHTFSHSGLLSVFANDAPSMRWNNRGAIQLTARQVALPTPPPAEPPVPRPSLLERWRELADAYHRTQGFGLILFLVVATGATLAATPQGQDLVTTVVEDATGGGRVGPLIWLCLATLALGFQAWLWSRAIVEFQFGRRACWGGNPLLTWTPRVLGLLPFAFLLGVLLSERPISWSAGLLALFCAAFLLFTILRERITEAVDDLVQRLRHRGRATAAHAVRSSVASLKGVALVAGLLAALVSMIWVLRDPVGASQPFGPAAVVLMAVAMIIPVMTLAVQMGRLVRIAVTPVLIVLALVFTLWVDNHAVRPAEQSAPIVRPTLAQAYARWRAQFPASPDRPLPIIFVASEGGASRAGYWTGDALSVLEQRTGGAFSKHLFAISSVSGGTLGAVGFLASLRDNPGLARQGALRKAVDDFTGQDYLSPALAGTLFPDLMQRFFPAAVFPDRAETLERGWEVGWRVHCHPVDGQHRALPSPCRDERLLNRNFLSLWPAASATSGEGWLPMLLVGGAVEETGRRVLTSSVDYGAAAPTAGGPPPGIAADDFHAVTGHDVRLSTAISNGARFFYISPAGTMRHPDRTAAGHIIDGGYFDAAGVETVRELARAVLTGPGRGDRLAPIFIIMENAGPAPKTVFRPADFGADAFGPLIGLYSSRPAHGDRLMEILSQDPPQGCQSAQAGAGGTGQGCLTGISALPAKVRRLSVCFPGAPLNWSLSQKAKTLMRNSIAVATAACPNVQTMEEVAAAVRP